MASVQPNEAHEFVNTPSRGCLVRICDYRVSTMNLMMMMMMIQQNHQNNNAATTPTVRPPVMILEVDGPLEIVAGHDTAIPQRLVDIQQSTRVLQAMMKLEDKEERLHQNLKLSYEQQQQQQRTQQQQQQQQQSTSNTSTTLSAARPNNCNKTMGGEEPEPELESHNNQYHSSQGRTHHYKGSQQSNDQQPANGDGDSSNSSQKGTGSNDHNNNEQKKNAPPKTVSFTYATNSSLQVHAAPEGEITELLNTGFEGFDLYEQVLAAAVKENHLEQTFQSQRHHWTQLRQQQYPSGELPQGGWYFARVPCIMPEDNTSSGSTIFTSIDDMGDLYDKIMEQYEADMAREQSEAAVAAAAQAPGTNVEEEQKEEPADREQLQEKENGKMSAKPSEKDASEHAEKNSQDDDSEATEEYQSSVERQQQQPSKESSEEVSTKPVDRDNSEKEGGKPLELEENHPSKPDALTTKAAKDTGDMEESDDDDKMEVVDARPPAASQPQGITNMLCSGTPCSEEENDSDDEKDDEEDSHDQRSTDNNNNNKQQTTSRSDKENQAAKSKEANELPSRKLVFEDTNTNNKTISKKDGDEQSKKSDDYGDDEFDLKTQDSEATGLGHPVSDRDSGQRNVAHSIDIQEGDYIGLTRKQAADDDSDMSMGFSFSEVDDDDDEEEEKQSTTCYLGDRSNNNNNRRKRQREEEEKHMAAKSSAPATSQKKNRRLSSSPPPSKRQPAQASGNTSHRKSSKGATGHRRPPPYMDRFLRNIDLIFASQDRPGVDPSSRRIQAPTGPITATTYGDRIRAWISKKNAPSAS